MNDKEKAIMAKERLAEFRSHYAELGYDHTSFGGVGVALKDGAGYWYVPTTDEMYSCWCNGNRITRGELLSEVM